MPHTSYIAEPALVLHPTAAPDGASKLLVVAAQQQCGVQTAADAHKLAAADMCMSQGLRSGSLIWLDDSAAVSGSSAQHAGMPSAWQPCNPQPQCIITEEGKLPGSKKKKVLKASKHVQYQDGH